jgi:hypothetical protein
MCGPLHCQWRNGCTMSQTFLVKRKGPQGVVLMSPGVGITVATLLVLHDVRFTSSANDKPRSNDIRTDNCGVDAGGSPFGDRLLSSSGLLALLCPMLKSLILNALKTPIRHNQFATICELSNLEELAISTLGPGPKVRHKPDYHEILVSRWFNFVKQSLSCIACQQRANPE